RNGKKSKKLGFVSGSIFSDGPQFVKANIKKLDKLTDKIRVKHQFPIFSAVDVLYTGVFERLPESKLPFEVRRPKFFKLWENIVECGFITDIFMAPSWTKSVGARKEHSSAMKMGMSIYYLESNEKISKE
ncbi:DUF4406 domain-containing protein, partial [Candidatus Roizmanbacteria bacterium]|nr:DUF4406 domain-containing protein [Candidatus Roizmanbacteria bacterium]